MTTCVLWPLFAVISCPLKLAAAKVFDRATCSTVRSICRSITLLYFLLEEFQFVVAATLYQSAAMVSFLVVTF